MWKLIRVVLMLLFFYITNESSNSIDVEYSNVMNNTNENIIESSTEKIDVQISEESIRDYFNMNRSELIDMLGDYWEGTEAIEESHMIFPVVVFNNELAFNIESNEDNKPTRISCSSNISFMGVNCDMDFSQVQEILGQTNIIETWIANEELKAYKIQYDLGEIDLEFLSYNRDGSASDMIFIQHYDE